MNFSHLRAMLLGSVWLLEESYLQKACAVLERRVNGQRLSDNEISDITFAGDVRPNGMAEHWAIDAQSFVPVSTAAAGGTPAPSVVAVINIVGVIAQHARQVEGISGPSGTSVERVTQSFRAAMADPGVKAIVLNFDSPGGNVFGVEALSDELFRARGQKPIVSQINSTGASAAYWLATQADEIVVTPGGQVGSIGAYSIHEDLSKKAENEGVKFTFVSAGKYKVDGNSFEPLSTDARDRIQAMVDMYYNTFVNAVARGRGVKADDVRNGFGQGGMEHAKNALKLNMADRIATLDETLRRVASARAKPTGAQALQDATTARSIELETLVEGSEKRVYLHGDWPAVTAIDVSLIENPDGNFMQVDKETGLVSFALENACARYQRTNIENRLGYAYWICTRVHSIGPLPTPQAAEEVHVEDRPQAETSQQTAEERDAFRRRRHAHRLRAPA